MNDRARTIFEAMMRGQGHTDFARRPGGNYANGGIQTRWKYFQLGWEMRGVEA